MDGAGLVRIVLAVLVLLLNAWALVGVSALSGRGRRVRWMALIVLAPVLGALLWARRSDRKAAA